MVYRGSKELPEYAYFVSIAQELSGLSFVYTDTAEYIIGRAEIPKNRLAIHKGTDTTDSVIFPGGSYMNMRDFIIYESLKGVVEENKDINDLINDNHFPALRIVCHDRESCVPYITMLNESNHHGHKLIKVFKVLSNRIHHVDYPTEKEHPPVHVSLLDSRKGHIHEHPYKGEASAEEIEKFIEKYFHKRQHAHHYSEHPDEHIHKIVKCITGHNYNREILKTTKGIVLLVHNGSDEEKALVESFDAAAEWLHSKKLGKYVKFRLLNQKKNLTPFPFYEKPVLLMIRPHTQHDPASHCAHEVKGNTITRKGLHHLIKNHGSYHIDPLIHENHVEEDLGQTDL